MRIALAKQRVQEVYNDWADTNANYDIYFIDAKGNLCHESVTHDLINQLNHVYLSNLLICNNNYCAFYSLKRFL